jgi:NADPH:quinone reductase-like Zn-dependent oxidoreductase
VQRVLSILGREGVTVKAVVYEKYGPPEVLQIREVEDPVPRDNELLIRIYATTAHVGDTRMRSFRVPRWQWLFARMYLGILRPRRKILGMELAGVVESVGKDVTRFEKGDRVFALLYPGKEAFGGYAEYKCLPEDGLVASMPENCSFEEATPLPASGVTALNVLRKADIQSGQRVMIYGASGAVGTFSVQLAKHFGAEVTGVCSTTNLNMVKSIGGDRVLDYTKGDFTQSNERYDVILDAVDKLQSSRGRKLLKKTGTYLNVGKDSDEKISTDDLLYLKELVEGGEIRSVIDRVYPLEQIVEAHRYVDKGHKKGNVVITVTQDT